MLYGGAAFVVLMAGEQRPGDEQPYVSGFTKCSASIQLRAAASKVSTRFLPFLSLCLPEINFAESLAKMSGWFWGERRREGIGNDVYPPLLLSRSFFISLSCSRSCSRSPLGLFVLNPPLPPFSFSGKFAFTACWRKPTTNKIV